MLKRVSDAYTPGYGPTHERSPASVGEGGSLDIMPYLAIARRRGPMVAGFGLLAGLLGSIYALQLVPQYTATATLLLDNNQANLPFSEQAYYGSYADDAKIESELAIISSTDVAKRVAQKLKLVRADDAADTAPAEPSLLALLYDQLTSLLSGGKAEPDPKADLLEADDPLERAARSLQGVSVKRQGYSYLIDVSYTSENPTLAAAVANGFADEYLVDQLESRYDATRRTNEWLSERLGDLRNKVREFGARR